MNDPRRSPVRRLALLLLAALVSAHFALTLARAAHPFLDVAAYAGFTAPRPFQYRLLMAPVLGGLTDLLRGPGLAPLLRDLPGWIAPADSLALAAINALAFLAALLVLWPLALRVHAGSRPLAAASTALFVALSYLFFCLNPNLSFALPYDVPALAFTLLALLLHRKGWWPALVLVFALGTLNRETILFVPVAIAVGALLPGGRRRDLAGAAGLVAVWIAIKAALAAHFAHLRSEEGLRLAYNLAELARPWQWPAIFILPLLFGLAAREALRRPPTLDLLLTALAGGALLFALGQITETRAFGELIPYLALGLAPMVQRWLAPLPSTPQPR